jgi:hypothetical protein
MVIYFQVLRYYFIWDYLEILITVQHIRQAKAQEHFANLPFCQNAI